VEKVVREEPVEQALARLKKSLLPSFDIGQLFARDTVAHKWKATFRSLLLREAAFWRSEDLRQQSTAFQRRSPACVAIRFLASSPEGPCGSSDRNWAASSPLGNRNR
jgi:hypothetical protein